MNQRIVPYTTKSGLQIGCRYEPKRVYEMSHSMELLQESLLGKPVQKSRGPVDWVMNRLMKLMRST